MFVWAGLDAFRAEVAEVELEVDRLAATGTQLGADPVGYRLDYRLETEAGFVTSLLHVDVRADGWTRSLELRRDGEGVWECRATSEGRTELPPPGGEVAPLAGALDCDLGLSPLTNVMPVRRHGIHAGGGPHDFTMAWVSVPDLALHPSRQRYEFVRATPAGGVVRYACLPRGFSGELELDAEGFVIRYPELAERRYPVIRENPSR